MQVLFRVDASTTIGLGHLVRCTTLALQLQAAGATIIFATKPETSNIVDSLRVHDFQVIPLPSESSTVDGDLQATLMGLAVLNLQPHWIVVDHYGLDALWERGLRQALDALTPTRKTRFLVIDDLANRPHDCEILLDQNLYLHAESRYKKFVSPVCLQLLGPDYALLKPQFPQAHQAGLSARLERFTQLFPTFKASRLLNAVSPSSSAPLCILVCFGGTDPIGETFFVLDALEQLHIPLLIDVVTSSANPQKQALAERCAQHTHIKFHCDTNAMAALMQNADLGLLAGGSMTWEKLSVGLPSITLAVADNQVELCEVAANQHLHIYLGRHADEEQTERVYRWVRAIRDFLIQPEQWLAMTESGWQLVNAKGTARVTAAMMDFKGMEAFVET